QDVDLPAFAAVRLAVVRKVDERAHRRNAGLLVMTAHRAGHATVGNLLHQSDLNGVVAVVLGGLLLHDEARPGLNHRHRDECSILGEHLSHADLLAYDSFDCHFVHLGTASQFMCSVPSAECRVPSPAHPGGFSRHSALGTRHYLPKALISTSTPAGSSSFMSASTVCVVGSRM